MRGTFRLRRGARPGDAQKPALLTFPFLVVLALTFLGFAFEQILRPVIPLIIIDRGGDAILVGVVAATHSLPSVLFRPLIGRLVDGGHHLLLLRFGALAAAIAPFGILLPGILTLALIRFVQGSAWALFVVSARTLMARLSPADRRGEASGYFSMMPALAMLLGSGTGVALYLASGEIPPVVVASALGLVAFGIVARARFFGETHMMPPRSQDDHHELTSRISRAIEPSALPSTLMLTMFLAGQALFTVFPPLYVLSVDASVETLAFYYPAYGTVMVLSQLLAGRVSDRLGRGHTIRIGCGMAAAGLATAALGDGMLTFFIGAVAYAVSSTVVIPTLNAMAIDRAPAARLGSAMATYSIGYELAIGISSLAWGTIIAVAGFPWALLCAIGLQLVTIAASLRFADVPRGGREL